ncbi:MAG: GNAT family N-acetyltransferase [Solirubrobacteraceae bacterium]|nr:GNAT family N-acetyltransferase [Solirubrobacteraceae bacterium]
MLTLNKARLRALCVDDLDRIAEHGGDLAVTAAAQPDPPFPLVVPAVRGRIERGHAAPLSGGSHDHEFAITFADDPAARLLGIAGLYNIDRFNSIAEIGVTITDPSSRGLGVGIDTYVLLARFAFRGQRLNKVYAQVKGSNTVALATCDRLGIRRHGVLPEHRWIDGAPDDLHIFGLLAREWSDDLIRWRERGPAVERRAA